MHAGGKGNEHAFSCKWGSVGGCHKRARMGENGASEEGRNI